MTKARNGGCAAIVAFVTANPGCTGHEIKASTGRNTHNGLLSYCVNTGRVFKSGPPRHTRFYPTRDLAEVNDRKHRAEYAEAARARNKASARDSNVRRRAKRHAAGVTRPNTRPDCRVHLAPNTVIADGVKITSVKAPPGRYEVTGHFVGQITQDWLARRRQEARP